MIQRVSETFVCTWILIDDATILAEKGNHLAETLAANWDFPINIMFLTPDGRLISKVSRPHLDEFTQANVDEVTQPDDDGRPPEGRRRWSRHCGLFMKHLDMHFGDGLVPMGDVTGD